MSNIDFLILAVVGLCVLMGLWRGFLLEGWGLLVWLLAILIPVSMADQLAAILPVNQVLNPETRFSIGAALLLIGVLFLGSVMRLLLTRIVGRSKRTITSRFLGAGTGALRGALIVSAVLLAATLVPDLQRESWWTGSTLISHFTGVSRVIHDLLPDFYSRYFFLPG